MSYNSDIDISLFKTADKTILKEIETDFLKKYKSIPDEFNWAFILHNDTESIKDKKKLISKVKNQYLCGCCWAISCATALSDNFVVSEIVNWSPNISYTYALSRYPQQKCSGGSSRILLEEIKKGHGIASDYCVDESWCLNNERCMSGDPSTHFTADNKEYLSSLIPPEGCYDGNKKHYVYTIDDVYSMTVTENLKVFEAQIKIKQQIMVRGPVVGGFLIMENFPSGEFTKYNGGIYLENSEYNPAKDVVFNFEEGDKILGSHSVVIVGWGVAKNVRFNGIRTNIPYWYCRNSWGEEWGDNGYFKIAMYPFNKISQFTKRIRVIHNGFIKEVGGITGIKVSKKPILQKIKSNNQKYEIFKSKKEMYKIDENLIHGLNTTNLDRKESAITIIALILAVVYLFSKN